MTDYVIDPPVQPAVPIADSEALFPVRRIWCVARNYAEHTREMGGDPGREPPFFFAKPGDAVVPGGGDLPMPPGTTNFHHEVELVVAIGTGGSGIAAGDALNHVYGYAVGLDMTRRDIQAEAKKDGRPWEMAKGFDRSCPIGAIHPVSRIGHPAHGEIALTVNGATRQDGDIADMIWSVPEIIAHLSALVELAPGDLIMTGTPAGVGPVHAGDVIEAACAGLGTLEVRYRAA